MSQSRHLEFAPPPPPGGVRAFGLALVIHALLMAALTWGVRWQQDNSGGVEAELWSAVPQLAAPKGDTLEPQPEPNPEPQPEPKPAPKPEPKPEPKPDPKPVAKQQPGKDAELAIEKKKKAEKERADKLKAQEEARKKEEKERKEKLQHEKELKEKKARAKAEQEKQEKAEEVKREALRQEQLRRMRGLADATGSPASTGTAKQTSGPSGPSAGYAGKVRGAILPNITFVDQVRGNPEAEVEVQCGPEGTIFGVKLTRRSGLDSWDEAVQKAIVKTGKLPRDTDGRIPCPMLITFRPQDQAR
jgi:colicin import membrane protein